jgi:nucleotide-binding universal stress UspA family protein
MAGIESVPFAWDDAELTAWARAQLKQLIGRESKNGCLLSSVLCTGRPFHEITVAAKERGVDMIVMATHGYTGVSHVLMGSTAERVVRHAPCPVLTVRTATASRRMGKTPPFKLRKILVPIDFSNLSRDALPWANLLATRFGAELILMNVTEEFPADYFLGGELMNHLITPLLKQAEADLEHLAARLTKSTGVKASAVVREGTPYKEICDGARRLGADLIVLTTHGFTGLKHVWLGSTAERVVRHAHCPVLAVRKLERRPVLGPIAGRTAQPAWKQKLTTGGKSKRHR